MDRVTIHVDASTPTGYIIEGVPESELSIDGFSDLDEIRKVEIYSIRRFVSEQRGWLSGRVLDFGAGKPGTCRNPEPYRAMVQGEYVPVDKGDPIPPGPYDAILCTQVAQFFESPAHYFDKFAKMLRLEAGRLVMTYPTAWPEVEEFDSFRYTKRGMQNLLWAANLNVLVHEERAAIQLGPNRLALGYGVVASVCV